MNIEGEHFYTACLYDYAILDQRFLQADGHLMSYQNPIPVRNAAGEIVDRYHDSVPHAVLMNIVQLSFSYMEKALKYIYSVYTKPGSLVRIRNFNHSLGDLAKAVDLLDPFLKDMPAGALEALRSIEGISFKTIRYFDSPHSFTVRPLLLKDLLRYTNMRIQSLRLKLYSMPALARKAQQRSNIKVFVPAPIAPPDRISSGLLDDLCASERLTDQEQSFPRSCYGDPDSRNYRKLLSLPADQFSELVRIIVKSELFAFWGHEFQFEIK